VLLEIWFSKSLILKTKTNLPTQSTYYLAHFDLYLVLNKMTIVLFYTVFLTFPMNVASVWFVHCPLKFFSSNLFAIHFWKCPTYHRTSESFGRSQFIIQNFPFASAWSKFGTLQECALLWKIAVLLLLTRGLLTTNENFTSMLFRRQYTFWKVPKPCYFIEKQKSGYLYISNYHSWWKWLEFSKR